LIRGGYLEEVEDAIAIFDSDRFIPGKPAHQADKGRDRSKCSASFVEQNPGVRFFRSYTFDCDLYLPYESRA